MIPTTQTSTASGLTSPMWNLETISSRFVRNTRWQMSNTNPLERATCVESHCLHDLSPYCLFSFVVGYWFLYVECMLFPTDHCKSPISCPRIRLQQQRCALWRSLHWQLRLCVRLSHVIVSIMFWGTHVSLTFLAFSVNPHGVVFL